VSSRIIFRAKDGRELGPEDYLQEFERFGKENPEQIAALQILLDRPKDFDTVQLKALRAALGTNPDNLTDKFTEKTYAAHTIKNWQILFPSYGMRPRAANCLPQNRGSARP